MLVSESPTLRRSRKRMVVGASGRGTFCVTTVQTFRQDTRCGKAPIELWKKKKKSRNRPNFCQNISPRALGPNLSDICCRVRQRSHIAGERAAMDPCVSSSGAHKELFLLLGTARQRGEIATSACAGTRRDSHTQREATKRHTPT